ncbi:alanyl-tRNA editing protein [Rhizobium sp. ZPR3]|uniref:Alanyl-tRNA editing protein n=2 Tax=unclassified Rhizobium TaxID=2613769 RepID=A0AAU7SRA9_9HYPH
MNCFVRGCTAQATSCKARQLIRPDNRKFEQDKPDNRKPIQQLCKYPFDYDKYFSDLMALHAYLDVRARGSMDDQFGAVMSTFLEFLNDPYKIETEAMVVSQQANRVIFDRTVFCPAIGTSPSDSGELLLANGGHFRIENSQWHHTKADVLEHVCEQTIEDLTAGDKLTVKIDWLPRYAAMRLHTALYLVAVALPYPVVQTAVGTGWGGLTFKVDDTGMHSGELERLVNRLVDANLPLQSIWIPRPPQDQVTAFYPVIWPGSNGRIRALRIGEFNVRPSAGLHVRHTAEVGPIQVTEVKRLTGNMLSCNIRLLDGMSFPGST